MRRVQCAACGALLAISLAACAGTASEGARVERPAAGGAVADVHPELAAFDVVEVALLRPDGPGPHPFRDGMREGMYRALLERNYSPLDPRYVDAWPPDAAVAGGPFVVRSAVTETRRTSDGGMLASGWAELVAPGPDGGAVYRMDLTDYLVPPVEGTEEKHGAVEAGRRLGEALLVRLPAR